MYVFRIIDMDIEHGDEITIHLSGLTSTGETVYCKVLGYQPYCFLELPVDIRWSSQKIEALKEFIRGKLPEAPPDVMKYEIKKMCLYSVTRPILRINFKNEDTWRHLKNVLKYTWRIPGFKEFPPNSFKLHEHNIPTLVKFGIERKIDMAGWIKVKAINPPSLPADFSRCTHSIYTKPTFVWKDDTPSDILVDPLICAFDIELHSTNKKSSTPKPEIPENEMTMISLTFGKLSKPLEEWETYVITQYIGDRDPDGKYKAEVIDCKGSEKVLIVQFCKLVKRNMPDIFTGYNINGFDWGCLLTRAQLHGLENRLYKMGKLKWEKGKLVDLSWASSARGHQEIKYIKSTGIFNFDIFPEIRFNHTLPMYKLSFVAKHFLKGEDKEDMPYQQMFTIFEIVQVLERNLETTGGKMAVETAKKIIYSKIQPEDILEIEGMTNHVAELYKELKHQETLDDVIQFARSFMLRLLKYVIQDSRICPALMKFLNSLTSLWENANVSKCPSNYIYEKGQQIKVLAQYADQAFGKNYVIPFYNKVSKQDAVNPDEEEEDDGKKNYQGATVLKVKKGLYNNIAVLDFASLYPSIMKAYNICHTQLVPPGDTTPDSECNIAKWSEHIRCEHDPEKRKKKKGEKAYCGDHLYRWRKHYGQDEKKGLLPILLESLGRARSAAKKSLAIEQAKWVTFKKRHAELSGDERREMELTYAKTLVLDSRQLAIKISMNSSYGFLGATTGYFPLIEGAASVTYYGREAIMKTIGLVESKYSGSEVIYGDSVTGDTPIIVYNGQPQTITIKELATTAFQAYPEFKPESMDSSDKQRCEIDGYWSLTDIGWSKIKRVIRHKCNKEIFRVISECGQVDVTEDHSLLDENGNQIKPKDLVIGVTQLLSVFKKANPIKSVTSLGRTTDFVYDLETECGRFHAGVGFNVVKNTDSVFIDFHQKDLKVIFELAHDAEKYVTSQFPVEMKIEMDHCYSPLLLKTKKKYSFTIVDSDGTALKDGSKGDINKRRDNCDAARDIYTLAETLIKKHEPQEHVLYEINNKILDIYRGLVPLHNFVIYKGLKQLVEEYKNCAGHVLFAKRLEERGNVMSAGTRLEYVFIKKRGKELKSGERMEDWNYFLMNRAKENLQIDYGYYIEHNVLKPTTEILNIAFPAPEKQYYKPEDNFKKAMESLLKPKWREALAKTSIEYKAKYIAKYSKKKALREAAKKFYAKVILDKLYKGHGLKIRQGHRPKIGSSVIYLNDKVILQIHKFHYDWNEVIWQIVNKSGVADWIKDHWEKIE